MVEQPRQSSMQNGKAIAEQRTPVAEQPLQMVPMIACPAMVSTEEEKKSKQEKRTEERVKCLRALRHTVNYVSAQEEFYLAAPMPFTKQDLYTVRLPHQDPLINNLQVG